MRNYKKVKSVDISQIQEVLTTLSEGDKTRISQQIKNNEMIRDTYASESLVKLAESLGFEGEPAHIDGVNGKKDYTLSLIQKWFRQEQQIDVVPLLYRRFPNDYICMIYYNKADSTSVKDEKGHLYMSYDEALERGLHRACMLLKERKNAEVLDG